jgi:nitrate/nitrite-specific signal transduction histidine kinase
MMIVKVESREFRLEHLVEHLERCCNDLTAAQTQLATLNKDLEQRIRERTAQLHEKNSELGKALLNLKQENKERCQAEDNLRHLYKEIEVTNQKLQDAYLSMRRRKDEWEARKYQESIVFMATAEGRIIGFTEKALEISRKSRSALLEASIQDILFPLQGRAFVDSLRAVRPRTSQLVTVRLADRTVGEALYDAKLTHFALEGKRLFYVVLYPHQDSANAQPVQAGSRPSR